MTASLEARWLPVAASADLVTGHVFHGELLDQELALWRDDAGGVNVWENRCVHRGVRLTIGAALGRELRCAYHGWRFASGTAVCTHIPAHPTLQPSDTVRIRRFEAAEAHGLVWTRLQASASPAPRGGDTDLVLRAIPIVCAPEAAATALERTAFTAAMVQRAPVRWFIQPVSAQRCIVRGVVEATPLDQETRRTTLRGFNTALEALRRRIEAPQ